MRLLYDDFQTFCSPDQLAISLDLVLKRLDERETSGKNSVELIPLPTGPNNVHRLKRLFRYNAYLRYYANSPETKAYLESGIREKLKANPRLLDDSLAEIVRELERRPEWVYANRDRGFTWDGVSLPPERTSDPVLDGDQDAIPDPRETGG